jgi:hypothetical protein
MPAIALKRGPRRFAYCESSSCNPAKYRHFQDEHSSASDHLKPINAHTKQLFKSRSESHLINPQNSIFPSVLRHLAFLWKRGEERKTCSQSADDCMDPPFDDIKQRWRRQQIATQQRLAPERSYSWGRWTRSRKGISRSMFRH